MDTALWWIRRDLRLADNQALSAALQAAGRVVPVFVLDPRLLASPWAGEKRVGFLFAALRSLQAGLQERGVALVVRGGDPLNVLTRLLAETRAGAIFAEADVSPYARRRDAQVARSLPLQLTPGLTVHPPGSILKADDRPYTVFTPFSRAWQARPFPGSPLPAPEFVPGRDGLPSDGIPAQPEHGLAVLFPAREAEGRRRLEDFIASRLAAYPEARNRLDLHGSSALSPYLRFGLISARQAAWAARQAELGAAGPGSGKGAGTWLNELIWREFYASILYHFPHVRRRAFRSKFRSIAWREAPEDFSAWAEGRTGLPVIDAGMRQLLQTGWMHNRARMLAASFLAKDLLIDWRRGERHFMQHLLDGDPAANNGGWQWAAGTGTDAAPYFRIFNPVLQGLKFDPYGSYVRRFVPELGRVPDEWIHTPWKLSLEQQEQFGCIIGEDYPAPLVDHLEARARALLAYKTLETQ